MSDFKVGSRVNIVGDVFGSGRSGVIKEIISPDTITYDEYHVLLDGERWTRVYFGEQIEFEDILEEEMFTEAYLTEMATIASSDGISIAVNQELKRLSIAYFKVYDNVSFKASTKVARLHFKGCGIEEHHRDPHGKGVWIPNKSEVKVIQRLLNKMHRDLKEYTNWQVLCYEWNRENELIPAGIDDYFAGKYDSKYDYESSTDRRLITAYVPSDTQMPRTWSK